MADDDDRPRLKFKFKLDSGFLNSEKEAENEVYSKLGKDKKKKKKKRRSDEEKKIKKSKKEKKAKRFDDDPETVSSLEDEPISKAETSPPPERAEVPQVESNFDKNSPYADAFKAVLSRFVGELEKLDPNGIFAEPVTDAIAPGYSTIIRNPMDFSTIKQKLDNFEYLTVISLRQDMILMLDNCTKYNTADTPFHQLALKLEKDVRRIVTIKRAAKFLKKNGVDPDGIDEVLEESRVLENEVSNEPSIDSDNDTQDGIPEKGATHSPRGPKKLDWAPLKPGTMELTEPVLENPDQCSHTDTMDAVDVLKSVTRAAAEARERLCLKYPGEARLGYITNAYGGKMEFTTINDGSGESGVTMPIIPVKMDSPEPEIDPVDYYMYGPYGDYQPTYDNRLNDFFNMASEKEKEHEKKNELSRLKKIYGGERELSYVQSIQYFVKDMEQPGIEAAEKVLNKVTHGLHETTRMNKMPVQDCKIDCKALETLKELGIDTSWLEAFDMNSPVFKKAELIDKTLQEAAELMSKINQDILNGDMSDEARESIKEQVGLLNKMLKTMIPLYGASMAGKSQHMMRHQHQQQVHIKSEAQQVMVSQEHGSRPSQLQTQHQVLVKQEITRDSRDSQIVVQHQNQTLVKQESTQSSVKTEVDASH